MKTILLCSLLALGSTWQTYAEDGGPFAEKRRVITKTFRVSTRDRVAISNQFGEVRITLWERPEVRAEINIIGYGSTEREAQELLDAVDIRDEHSEGVVRLETVYQGKGSAQSWWAGLRAGQNLRERGVRINYVVSMPKYTSLDMHGRFSDTFIPEFEAPLTVRTEHGRVSAGRLSGTVNDIRVEYGQATIKNLAKGKLDLSYSKLNLEQAEELELAYKNGQLLIGEVNKLIADLSYSRGQIERLRESAEMRMSFVENFRLPALASTVKRVNIESSYCDVLLPIAAAAGMDFNVTVRYADFRYPQGTGGITVTRSPAVPRPPRPPQPPAAPRPPAAARTYQGTVGKGGTDVKINSVYGTVRFQKEREQ
jgi:hypothetical protein